MSAQDVRLEIDHRPLTCQAGLTILRAAELNGIYIPSLCSHKDLTPFGGCRLCMVEVEGRRGFPLACSTVVEEGMKVLTETSALRGIRREILELILSEHPSSCLICDEKADCKEILNTIRKAGVTTGCRYCPNDSQCELQTVVDKLGVTEMHYPVYYRGYEAEHDDPFFDRDYNVCILCGRCVRMCQEVRGASVLAFQSRGPKTHIGTAFGRSHVEAGCEFCGACLFVCPTGTLAEKSSKWDGAPDGSDVSTCPFCSLGCQVEVFHKNGRLSRVQPSLDPEVNDGQLCVRGRFCLPETTHHHERARKPMLKRGRYFREVTWDEALEEVTPRLKGLSAQDFLMAVSPDLTNESLFAAQKFVRACMGSNNIDTTARQALPGSPELWAGLFSLPVSVRGLARAGAVIAVGLDSRFSFSVAGVEVRRALKSGAKLVTIDARESNLARYAHRWLRPKPGGEAAVLRALAVLLTVKSGKPSKAPSDLGVDGGELERAAAELAGGGSLAVLVGPSVFAADARGDAAAALFDLAARDKTTILPLYQGANTRGALELGAFGEWLPGLEKARTPGLTLAALKDGRIKPKVLYLVGETPFFERPECDFLIVQDIYRPPFEVDVFLPAASFAEAEGTLTNVEGRVQRLVRTENLPDGASTGFTRPDWFIFREIASRLSCSGFGWQSAGDVLLEIAAAVKGFPSVPDRKPRRLEAGKKALPPPAAPAAAGRGDYILLLEGGGFRHRGLDLSAVVEGLGELGLEEGFRLHPGDIEALGLKPGDTALVSWNGTSVEAAVKADPDLQRGTVAAFRPSALGGLRHRRGLEPLIRLEAGLWRVSVSAPKPAGPEARAAKKKK